VELARPSRVIGKSTVEALQSGIIFGFAGQVEGIASRMAAELAPSDPDSVTIIATGGLAPLVIDEVAVIDAYEPWLTLIGLRLTYERNTVERNTVERTTGERNTAGQTTGERGGVAERAGAARGDTAVTG
jgi:type III pantothenate kinase